ncbi:hypothetical protein CHS0354_012563 [Potamilus streckersoni]|uniref:Beta-lactamase-related domain-containing protein n=1 Tax=Potamilus streckersoni TaxID=2493646 RepID=A0AAE0SXU3_9BIVA|nr:hypothetical protein CHS0354_012563 [Potamilus streckersoni]
MSSGFTCATHANRCDILGVFYQQKVEYRSQVLPNHQQRLQFIPATKWFRSKFLYSNYMYTLAGHVAEVLGGRNWETLVQESLLTPLCMHNTGFVDQLDNRNDLASPYVLLNGILTEVDRQLLLSVHPAGPAGSIYSTPVDMSKWILFHLNRGIDPNGRSIVSEEWLNETYNVQMPQPFSRYRKIWHSGGIVTYTSHLWLFPEKNTGVFVTFNGPLSDESSFAMEAIIGRAADLLLGEEPWMNLTTACTFPSPWRQAKDPRHPCDEKVHKWNISRSHIDYIGVYGHLAFGNISVGTDKEKELTLRFGRFGEMNIWPVSETRFHGRYTGSLWFITGSQDNVDPIEIDFVASEAGDLEGLLFPVDFKSNKTLFERDLTLNSYRKWHNMNSKACDSRSKLGSVRTYLLILLYLIFTHFHTF